jgi:beta-glucanase (GH16 family)
MITLNTVNKLRINIILIFLTFLLINISGQNSNYHLVWSDEFKTDGNLNSKYWTKEIMASPPNNELEYYVDSLKNSFIKSGNLYLRAFKENKGDKKYTSARLITSKKVDWTYGKLEVRAKLPKGFGTWPAIWMLYTNPTYGGWPSSGEIDIMEHVGKDEGNVHASAHGDYYNFLSGHVTKTSTYYLKDACTSFHDYICEWTPDTVKVYVDNKKIFAFGNEHKGWERWPYDHDFFLILNVAIGGDWGGTVNDAIFANDSSVQMVVDYVRLYKRTSDFKITGLSVIQENLTTNYSVPYYPGFSYKWTLPANAVALTKTDSSKIKLKWGCSSDTISVKIKKDNDSSIIKLPVSLSQLEVHGKIWVDPNVKSVKYYADSLPGTKFKWTADEGINFIGPDSTKNVCVYFDKEGRIMADITTGCNIYKDTINVRFGDGQFPYPDSAITMTIPGKIVVANFDYGGEGISYHDTEKANQGNKYRLTEGVDIESNDGGYTLGWFNAGEWVEYTVYIADSGSYNAAIRASSSGGGSFDIVIDGKVVKSVAIPNTGAWTTFTTTNVKNINLPVGKHILQITSNGGFNLGNITFSKALAVERLQLEEIKLFPNPANSIIQITSGKQILSAPEVYSIDGKIQKIKVSQFSSSSCSLNISSLRQGLYFIKIKRENGYSALRFIKE